MRDADSTLGAWARLIFAPVTLTLTLTLTPTPTLTLTPPLTLTLPLTRRVYASMQKPAFVFDGRNLLDHKVIRLGLGLGTSSTTR